MYDEFIFVVNFPSKIVRMDMTENSFYFITGWQCGGSRHKSRQKHNISYRFWHITVLLTMIIIIVYPQDGLFIYECLLS